LEEETVIFTDLSAQTMFMGGNSFSHLLRATNIDNLDIEILRQLVAGSNEFSEWFANPNVYASGKVLKEARDFKPTLRGRKKLAKSILSKNGSRHVQTNEYSDQIQKRDLLMEINRSYADLCSSISSAKVTEDSLFYIPAQAMVLAVADDANSKIDFRPNHSVGPTNVLYRRMSRKNFQNKSKKKQDLHTDEGLIALALTRVMHDDVPASIFTGDSDITRITTDVIKYLTYIGSDADSVLNRLEQTPIRIYFTYERGRVRFDLDTAEAVPRIQSYGKRKLPEKVSECLKQNLEYTESLLAA
tara:strand:+ start:30835 stop:31737 length:903 start_codon:yes stop_codon:yes gene_type:complete